MSTTRLRATVQKWGRPHLRAGFGLAEVTLDTAFHLHPGQWITATEGPVALFDQTGENRLTLLMPETLPTSLSLEIQGTPQTPPQQAVLLGQGLPGLGGVLYAARHWRNEARLLALLALETLPFDPVPSRIWLPALPPDAIATLPLLEDWGVPCRLSGDFPGATDTPVEWMAEQFITAQPETWSVLSLG